MFKTITTTIGNVSVVTKLVTDRNGRANRDSRLATSLAILKAACETSSEHPDLMSLALDTLVRSKGHKACQAELAMVTAWFAPTPDEICAYLEMHRGSPRWWPSLKQRVPEIINNLGLNLPAATAKLIVD
jgi:hypothetical protein